MRTWIENGKPHCEHEEVIYYKETSPESPYEYYKKGEERDIPFNFIPVEAELALIALENNEDD